MEIDDKYKDIIFESVHYFIRFMNEKATSPAKKVFGGETEKQKVAYAMKNIKSAQEFLDYMEDK